MLDPGEEFVGEKREADGFGDFAGEGDGGLAVELAVGLERG